MRYLWLNGGALPPHASKRKQNHPCCCEIRIDITKLSPRGDDGVEKMRMIAVDPSDIPEAFILRPCSYHADILRREGGD